MNKPLPALIFSGISAILSLWEINHTTSQLGEYAALVTKGAGYYLNLISAIALVVLCVLSFLEAKKNA